MSSVMPAKTTTLIDQYLEMQLEYEKKYGKDVTVVLMCVGSFYELYQVKSETENIGCAEKVAQLTNIVLTKKNKSIPEVSRSNPMLAGFPTACLPRYLSLLVDSGYTVVVVDQVTPPPNPKREVTGIYSPGTLVTEDNFGSPDSNNIVCITIGQEPLLNSTATIYTAGLSCLDVSTGRLATHEAISSRADPEFAIEDAIRFTNTYTPKEILVYNSTDLEDSKVTQLLNLTGCRLYFFRDLQPCSFQIAFQEQLLHTVYPDTGMLTAIEYLDLERRPLATLSLTLLLNYCQEQGRGMLKQLQRPENFQACQRLVLEHNAITQLNVLPLSGAPAGHRLGSLFDVFASFTSTAMGRRMLRSSLIQPLTNMESINTRLDMVEFLTKRVGKRLQFEVVEECLSGIPDIERLSRRTLIHKILPHELGSLMESFEKIEKLFNTIKAEGCLSALMPDATSTSSFASFCQKLHDTFELPQLQKGTLSINIFKAGVQEDADQAVSNLQQSQKDMAALAKYLNDLADDGPTAVTLEHTLKEGHYLSTTARRAARLKKAMTNSELKDILTGITTDSLKYDINKNSCKISCQQLEHWSLESIHAAEQLKAICQDRFADRVTDYFTEHLLALQNVGNFISTVDCLKAAAKAAVKYKYCRPTIVDADTSFIRAQDMRHPIVERIMTRCEYVPFPVNLGTEDSDMDIMLLFGANACGKSTCMRAVGLSIVMAQCGMFVPAKTMSLAPFTRIMTRIEGKDDLFNGQSTFAVEMGELRGILQRADHNSLVLGDEVAHGTETTSAVAIVTAALTWLHKNGAKALFATHLHQLAPMERIQKLPRVKCMHLEVHCDNQDNLVYDRTLKPGPGDGSYGLEVAKALRLDPSFIDMAHEIRRELLGDEGLVSTASSRYNSNLFMRPCEVCRQPGREVHHVKQQKDADENGFIDAMHKNHLSNLVVLCNRCHDMVHHPDPETGKQLQLSELKLTSNGPSRECTLVETTIVSKQKKPRAKRIARPEPSI